MRKEFRAHGIRVLLSRHPDVRRLKRERFPTMHGNRVWSSSWLLMDYLNRKGLAPGSRVMEAGCGWGLASVYCAKKHQARVTGVDADEDVFPFLGLHAKVNGVEVDVLRRDFNRITTDFLGGFDLLIAADVCFWDELVRPIRNLVLRALRAGVKEVLIADPGRSPFESVCEHLLKGREGEILDWSTKRPRRIRGRILRMGKMARPMSAPENPGLPYAITYTYTVSIGLKAGAFFRSPASRPGHSGWFDRP